MTIACQCQPVDGVNAGNQHDRQSSRSKKPSPGLISRLIQP
jgi:hypothetical protein